MAADNIFHELEIASYSQDRQLNELIDGSSDLDDRPDFDIFYVVPAGRLAARTRSTAGQRFAGAWPWRRSVPIKVFIAINYGAI